MYNHSKTEIVNVVRFQWFGLNFIFVFVAVLSSLTREEIF